MVLSQRLIGKWLLLFALCCPMVFTIIPAPQSEAASAMATLPPGGHSADFGYAHRDSVNMIGWRFKATPTAKLHFELRRKINGSWITVAHKTETVGSDAPLGQFIWFTQEYNGPIRGNTPYQILVTNKSSFSTSVTGWPN